MARWDEILTLPVQNPPALEFSASDIVWSRVEGWRETMDRLALIPFSRVNDFVRGESNNKECPTRFHVEARRRRPPEMAYKPKVDGVLEYILYWCSFGPDDHRKGGSVRPSRTFSTKRKTPAGRPNTKRGCVCHFIVKRLIAEPSVALIIYNQDKHIDKKGLPCHGPLDKKAVGTRAMFAPYISDDLRLQLMSLLYVGVPVETIMQKHTEMVEKQGGPSSRDDLLTHRYVRRLERKIRRSTYDLDSDDAVSIQLWVENHQNLIFFYEDFSDSDPFVLGIQSEWQLQQMIRFGNNSIMASDSRFGINKLKYPIYSLLVFDSNNKSIPVAWIITPNFASGDLHRWMGALYDRVHTKDPTWKLGGFIVDDPSADVLTIREIFQCPVLISLWRIRHAWHKNLMDKCLDTELRAEMSKRLGNALSNICRGGGDVDLFESFMEDFVDCSDFLDYFKAIWFPRIGLWATAMKALPLASSEASVAIEYYHHQLKLRLLNEKDSDVYQRADWLVDKLGTEVHSYFWLDEYSGKDNFARYWKDEWRSGLTSWQLALQIPDSDVIMDNQCTKIVCSRNREEMHIVRNPTSEFALCDCSWSRMGNLCKHVIKAAKICRDMGLASPSTSLFEYNRTLMNILHCPPQDSLMRDHAVALAVCVQSQLDTEFNLEKSKTTSSVVVPTELQRLAPSGVSETDGVGNVNKDLVNGSNSALENGGDLRNEDLFNIKGDIARETAIDDLMDIDSQSVETASTSMVHNEKQMVDGNAFASDGVGHEPENLLDEGLDLGSSMCNIIANVDGSQGGDLGDSCGNEATVAGEGSNQPSVDVVANSISRKVVTMDPESSHNLPSKSSPGVSNDVSEEACKIKISEISMTTKKASDLAEENSFETMTIDTVEINSGVSNDSKMKQLMSSKCHGSVHQEDNIDGNNIVTESGAGGNVENSGNQDQTTDTPSGNQSTCGDIVGRHGMETWISGVWDLDEKKGASNSNLEISVIGLKACSVLDSSYGETEDVVMKSADAAGKVDDGEVVLKRNETISDNNGKSLEEIISSV